MTSVIDQLNEFLTAPQNRGWLVDKYISVYVRKGSHFMDGKGIIQTLDIGNVQTDIQHRGQGHFKRFMLHAESVGLPVFVENIQNRNLKDMLKRNGYEILEMHYSTHAIKFPPSEV